MKNTRYCFDYKLEFEVPSGNGKGIILELDCEVSGDVIDIAEDSPNDEPELKYEVYKYTVMYKEDTDVTDLLTDLNKAEIEELIKAQIYK